MGDTKTTTNDTTATSNSSSSSSSNSTQSLAAFAMQSGLITRIVPRAMRLEHLYGHTRRGVWYEAKKNIYIIFSVAKYMYNEK